MVLKFHSDDTITKSGFRAILTGIFYKKNILPFFTHYWFEIGVPAKKEKSKKAKCSQKNCFVKILHLFAFRLLSKNANIFVEKIFIAKCRFVFAFFATFIFAKICEISRKKFAQYERKILHFFAKRSALQYVLYFHLN